MSVFRRQSVAPEATVTRTSLDENPAPPLMNLGGGFAASFDVPPLPAPPVPAAIEQATDTAPEPAKRTFIAADAVFEGTFHGAKDIVVEGQIHGDVKADTVQICPGAVVIGKIVSQTLTIAGKLQGDAETGELLIRETADITGNLLYDTIDVSRGANLDSTTRRRPAPVTAAVSAPIAAPISAALATAPSNTSAGGVKDSAALPAGKAATPPAANDKASGAAIEGPISASDVKQIGETLMLDPKPTHSAAKA